ncbi:MAG: VCBS repeat-containing protein, partial [Desulfovibrionales bacterium]|nr:VCBS repeat-containing protein [Desulfovibrionales bacterium]
MKKQLLYSNPKYYSLLKKYNKLYLRLKDMLTSGLYHTLAQRTQKTLYNKFKKLYSRLNKLNLSLGLKLSGVVVAFTLISNAVSAQTTPKIWIERPEGTNVFTQTLNPKGQSLAKFVDIDGDGDDDLFLGGRNTNYNYKFYRNQGVNSDTLFVFEDNSVDSLSVLPISTTSNIPPYFDFYDNDGDGDLDIYATNPDTASGLVVYYKNVGTTTNPDFVLTTGTENKFASIDSVYSIAFVNFDDDSDQDVVFMGSVVHSADYYKNDGGTFTRQIGTNDPFSALGLRGTAIDFLDLNNDNLLDAIANDHFNLLTLEQVRNGDTINFVSTTDAINI